MGRESNVQRLLSLKIIKLKSYITHIPIRIISFFFQEVAVILRDEICWIGLTERKRINKRGFAFKLPIFVAHFPGQPYFFMSHSGLKGDILHVSFVTLNPLLLND